MFAIDSVDRFWIYSEDFVAGDVTVTISDTEGNIYETTNDFKFYEMTPYTWGRPVYGVGYKWVEGLPNDVLVNKKDIKVSVTQNINGVDVTKKFEFSNDELKKIYKRDVYYWGNPFIECDS